jgi:hypothetical protein
MEGSVFPLPAVAGDLRKNFIEARLHFDKGPRQEENMKLQLDLGGSRANPIYVVYDPVKGERLRRKAGYMGEEKFLEFLRKPIE